MANKATMSVPEMRELLGLKKTESYWLLKKNYFDVVIINRQLRIVITSFEEWYENQVHYKKINGPEPGACIKKSSYSVADIADELGITDDSVRDMIHRHHIPYFVFGQQWRIDKLSFNAWYSHQHHYRNKADRERDLPFENISITIPEFGRMLGLERDDTYRLVREVKTELQIIVVGEQKRITKDSIDHWLNSQSEYKKVDKNRRQSWQPRSHNKPVSERNGFDRVRHVSAQEAAKLLCVDVATIYRMIRDKRLPAVQTGKQWRVLTKGITEFLNEGREE